MWFSRKNDIENRDEIIEEFNNAWETLKIESGINGNLPSIVFDEKTGRKIRENAFKRETSMMFKSILSMPKGPKENSPFYMNNGYLLPPSSDCDMIKLLMGPIYINSTIKNIPKDIRKVMSTHEVAHVGIGYTRPSIRLLRLIYEFSPDTPKNQELQLRFLSLYMLDESMAWATTYKLHGETETEKAIEYAKMLSPREAHFIMDDAIFQAINIYKSGRKIMQLMDGLYWIERTDNPYMKERFSDMLTSIRELERKGIITIPV